MQLRINRSVNTSDALSKIKSVFDQVVPSAYFEYSFVNQAYDLKFNQEERIGKLAGIFSVLAILISCLGLFGLASFVAEQRTKEIGIRKVMGASVAALWRMLSKEFVLLVLIACLLAILIRLRVYDRSKDFFQRRIERPYSRSYRDHCYERRNVLRRSRDPEEIVMVDMHFFT